MKINTYDEFVYYKLCMQKSYSNEVFPSDEEIEACCIACGVGVLGLSRKQMAEKLLYEYGLDNADIKKYFGKYLGLCSAHFEARYGITSQQVKLLEKLGMLPVVYKEQIQIYGKMRDLPFYDAEFYFDRKKFAEILDIEKLVIQILE